MRRGLRKSSRAAYAQNVEAYIFENWTFACTLSAAALVGSIALWVPTGGLAGAVVISTGAHGILLGCF